MIYYGKTLDTFAPAIHQLIEYEGLPEIACPDCVSLRAFGVRTDGSAADWFRPFIDTESAVKRLGEISTIPLSVFRLQEGCNMEELAEAFVLGPVKGGIAAPVISEYYYNGDGRYLFVRREKGRYEVSDPYGFPGLWMEGRELEGLCVRPGCCVICLDKRPDVNRAWQMVSNEQILRQGLAYHREIWELEERSIADLSLRYADMRGERIALRCGVQNMIQMLDKVFALAEECGWQGLQQVYTEKKQKLFWLAEAGNIQELSGILISVWRILEEYGE